MKHITFKWPHIHSPTEAQSKWLYVTVVAALVIAALVAGGWYLGVGGFGEWSLFEE